MSLRVVFTTCSRKVVKATPFSSLFALSSLVCTPKSTEIMFVETRHHLKPSARRSRHSQVQQLQLN